MTDRTVNSNPSVRHATFGHQKPQREVIMVSDLVLTDIRAGYRVVTLNAFLEKRATRFVGRAKA
ncbi:putative HAD superfamily phosphohydrolase YqeG [Bradyrhizobium sp. USDA 4501]